LKRKPDIHPRLAAPALLVAVALAACATPYAYQEERPAIPRVAPSEQDRSKVDEALQERSRALATGRIPEVRGAPVDPKTYAPKAIIVPAPPAPRRGAIDPKTGGHLPPARDGVIDARTGQFYRDTGPAYVNPRTGRVIPKR